MYEENPAVDMFKAICKIVKTGKSAAGMRQAVPAIAALATKILAEKRGQME